MATYKVECVDQDPSSSYDDCRCIERIGFPSTSGGTVYQTPEEVYDIIEVDGDNVVVEHRGSRTQVEGVKRGSTKYVRSEPNDTKNDNLLKQTSC